MLKTFFIGIGALIIYIVLTTLIIWGCWNEVMPDIFGLPTITFWQAFILDVLASTMFGVVSKTTFTNND